MPLVWRVCRRDKAHLLDGAESREEGGRWNSPGRAVVYAAENLALAALECFANLPVENRLELPEMAAVGIHIPEADALTIERGQFETVCSNEDGENWCRNTGNRWLDEGRHLVLIAPSITVPRERNFMLNPSHRAMSGVQIAVIEPYRFDPRLIGGALEAGSDTGMRQTSAGR